MELRWTDDLSVGNAMIDSGHRELLDVAGSVVHAIETEDCLAFSQAFELFEKKLLTYSANEEHIAQMVKFPCARYKAAAQHFQRELDLFKQELLSRKCQCCADAIEHYSGTLKRLLTDHIAEKGKLMKPFLQNFSYDLDRAES